MLLDSVGQGFRWGIFYALQCLGSQLEDLSLGAGITAALSLLQNVLVDAGCLLRSAPGLQAETHM